jgi:hypothetical protein
MHRAGQACLSEPNFRAEVFAEVLIRPTPFSTTRKMLNRLPLVR